MDTISGIITLVQEERFQLLSDDGVTQLFVTLHDAPVEIDDLQALERNNIPVTVSYTRAEGLIAWAAHDVDVALH
jgi:hypothetical protein